MHVFKDSMWRKIYKILEFWRKLNKDLQSLTAPCDCECCVFRSCSDSVLGRLNSQVNTCSGPCESGGFAACDGVTSAATGQVHGIMRLWIDQGWWRCIMDRRKAWRCGDWRQSRNSLSVSGGQVVLPDSHKSLFTYFLSTFFLRATAT